jgi:hypothetical protein
LVDFLNNSLADELKWPFHFTSGVEKLFCREFQNAKRRQSGKRGESRFSMAPCCCLLTSFSLGRDYTAFLAKPVTFHLDHTHVSMRPSSAPIPAPPPPVAAQELFTNPPHHVHAGLVQNLPATVFSAINDRIASVTRVQKTYAEAAATSQDRYRRIINEVVEEFNVFLEKYLNINIVFASRATRARACHGMSSDPAGGSNSRAGITALRP